MRYTGYGYTGYEGEAMSELVNAGDPIAEGFATGPSVGEPVPDFALPDQSGSLVCFSEVRGDDRALILFHRSASW